MDSSLDDLHPVLKRVYYARGIQSIKALDYRLKNLLHFKDLKGIDKTTAILAEAIIENADVLIVGDFDVDGATSTALVMDAFTLFGAKRIRYVVPNRFEYGYGLTPEIVASVEKPDVIMTVDNGISSHAGVTAAQQQGMRVVITDHHLPPEVLPEADAIVNPQQPGDSFSSKHLAGVGVAFYVMLALRDQLQQMGWFEKQKIAYPKMTSLLDLVALGTIADMVPLDTNNRILVYQGMQRIKGKDIRPGLKALAQVAGCDLMSCSATDLSFKVAPRLNAAGRLKDMSLGIECLLAKDMTTAMPLAQQLDNLNKERQTIEHTMQKKAFLSIEKFDVSEAKRSICLFDTQWHQGVTGLVAGRIKERFKCPAVVFAPSNIAGELKGSARSIPGIHIRDILATIAVKHPYLLNRFGGHAAAAGLSLSVDYYPKFVLLFEEVVQQYMADKGFIEENKTDGVLEPDEMALQLALLLRESGPWGQGFPAPLFEGNFTIISQELLKQRHLKLILQHPNISGKKPFKGILFNVDVKQWPNLHIRDVQATYHLEINEWEGRRDIQLHIKTLTAINKNLQPSVIKI